MRLVDKSLFDAVKSAVVDVEYLRFLLNAGASADAVNEYGRTPLLEMLDFVLTEIGEVGDIGADYCRLKFGGVLGAALLLEKNMTSISGKQAEELGGLLVEVMRLYEDSAKGGFLRNQAGSFADVLLERLNVIKEKLEEGLCQNNSNITKTDVPLELKERVEAVLRPGVAYSKKYDMFLSVLRDSAAQTEYLRILVMSGVRPMCDLLVRELFAKAHKQVRVDSRTKFVEYVEVVPKHIGYLLENNLVDCDAVLSHCYNDFDDFAAGDFEYGYSALMLAVKYGWYEIAALLKKANANEAIVADDGKTVADLVEVVDKERAKVGLKLFKELFVANEETVAEKVAAKEENSGGGRIKYDWSDKERLRGGQNLPMSQLVSQIVHDWVLHNEVVDFAQVDAVFNDVRRDKDGLKGYWGDLIVEMDDNMDVKNYPGRFDIANPIVLNGRRYVVNISWGTVSEGQAKRQRDCWAAFLDCVRGLGYRVSVNQDTLKRMLTTMGRSWFVSYAYYKYIDSAHKNWARREKYTTAAVKFFNLLTREHRNILQDIYDNADIARLSQNQIGLTGQEVRRLAGVILESNKV